MVEAATAHTRSSGRGRGTSTRGPFSAATTKRGTFAPREQLIKQSMAHQYEIVDDRAVLAPGVRTLDDREQSRATPLL